MYYISRKIVDYFYAYT